MSPDPRPLSTILAAERQSEAVVAVVDGTAVSFTQFRADVAHNAARLRAAGCRRGAPVCGDSYWFAVGLLALLHAEACVILPPNAQPGTLEALRPEFDILVADTPSAADRAFVLERGLGDSGPMAPFDAAGSEVDFFTSGSGGQPKRVAKSALLLEREVASVAAKWGAAVTSGLVSSTVSHQHIYGLIFKVLWPLCGGRPFSGAVHALWEPLMDELAPGGVLVTSPAHLTRLTGIGRLAADSRPGMVLSAGARLPGEAAVEAAEIFGVPTTEIFGSTETGAFATRAAAGREEPWMALPGVEIGFAADGRLRIRAPHVAGDTWVETEDLASPLPGGGFRFDGRADRVVKIEGNRVSLAELETRLASLALVAAAAVAVVGGEAGGLGAAVVLTREGEVRRTEIGGFRFGRLLRRQLARTQAPAGLPRFWRFVNELPSANMGKLRTRDIEALFRTGDAP